MYLCTPSKKNVLTQCIIRLVNKFKAQTDAHTKYCDVFINVKRS